jgi:hypothetical protein
VSAEGEESLWTYWVLPLLMDLVVVRDIYNSSDLGVPISMREL